MANEKRLIDAAELDRKLEALAKKYAARGRLEAAKDYSFVQTVLLSAPTVDAVEVVHGRWVSRMHKNTLGDYFRFHCSECGEDKPNSIHINYCPNCGAKMDGGNEDG